MNKNLLIVLVVVVVAVAGYFLLMKQSAPAEVAQEPTSAISKSVALVEQNDSGESGTAMLAEQDGQLVVTLELAGAPAGVPQPAHIHSGSCAEIGGVVYSLEFPVDGKSVTTLPISLSELAAQQPLAINVHKSSPLASVYVSCGDLAL